MNIFPPFQENVLCKVFCKNCIYDFLIMLDSNMFRSYFFTNLLFSFSSIRLGNHRSIEDSGTLHVSRTHRDDIVQWCKSKCVFFQNVIFCTKDFMSLLNAWKRCGWKDKMSKLSEKSQPALLNVSSLSERTLVPHRKFLIDILV